MSSDVFWRAIRAARGRCHCRDRFGGYQCMTTLILGLTILPARDRLTSGGRRSPLPVVSVDAASDHGDRFPGRDDRGRSRSRVRLVPAKCAAPPSGPAGPPGSSAGPRPGPLPAQPRPSTAGRASPSKAASPAVSPGLRPARPPRAPSTPGRPPAPTAGRTASWPRSRAAALRLPAKTIDGLLFGPRPLPRRVRAPCSPPCSNSSSGGVNGICPPSPPACRRPSPSWPPGCSPNTPGPTSVRSLDAGLGATDTLRVQAFIERFYFSKRRRADPRQPAAAHQATSLRHLQRSLRTPGPQRGPVDSESATASDRARRDLAPTPSSTHSLVSAIGARWGFRNDAHFNRAFCLLFGVSPGVYRRGRSSRSDSPP